MNMRRRKMLASCTLLACFVIAETSTAAGVFGGIAAPRTPVIPVPTIGDVKAEVDRGISAGKETVGIAVEDTKAEVDRGVSTGKETVGIAVEDTKAEVGRVVDQSKEIVGVAREQVSDGLNSIYPGGFSQLAGKLLGLAIVACVGIFILMLPLITLRVMFRLAFGRRAARV